MTSATSFDYERYRLAVEGEPDPVLKYYKKALLLVFYNILDSVPPALESSDVTILADRYITGLSCDERVLQGAVNNFKIVFENDPDIGRLIPTANERQLQILIKSLLSLNKISQPVKSGIQMLCLAIAQETAAPKNAKLYLGRLNSVLNSPENEELRGDFINAVNTGLINPKSLGFDSKANVLEFMKPRKR